MYGGAARARRHGGIVKIFHWEGEPQRELDTATMSLRTFDHSNHGIYLQRPPFLPYSIRIHYMALLHGTATERTNRIRPGKSVMSLSFPTLPDSLDIPTQHFIFLYIFGWGCA